MKRLLNSFVCLAGFLSSLAAADAAVMPAGYDAAGPGPKVVVAVLHFGMMAKAGAVNGCGGIAVAANAVAANVGAARFQFKNLIAGMEARDSMLIIFDRCDHTGAGVVYQVFAADKGQGITVPAVPPGKYFVTVECIGLHRDRLERIVTIKSRRSETVRIKLAPAEAFSRNDVVIPPFHPDLSGLALARVR